MKKLFLVLWVLAASTEAFAQKAPKPLNPKKDYLVTISTAQGDLKVILFDQTPLHKANFVKLAKDHFYDGLLFHRVIENFMIQGGDPGSRDAAPGKPLGNGDNGYTIPAEFDPALFHRKGALAAARNNNPKKESSGCQFYFVQGRVYKSGELEKQIARSARKPSPAQKKVYETVGGTPHLDGAYTVFGQVIDGLEVIDKIAALKVNDRDRPVENFAMKKVKVKTMRRSRITKKYHYQYD